MTSFIIGDIVVFKKTSWYQQGRGKKGEILDVFDSIYKIKALFKSTYAFIYEEGDELELAERKSRKERESFLWGND